MLDWQPIHPVTQKPTQKNRYAVHKNYIIELHLRNSVSEYLTQPRLTFSPGDNPGYILIQVYHRVATELHIHHNPLLVITTNSFRIDTDGWMPQSFSVFDWRQSQPNKIHDFVDPTSLQELLDYVITKLG